MQITPRYDDLLTHLARGWNTWNAYSVLCHVLLPEGFALNVGFCLYGKRVVVTEALFGREDVRPGAHAYDGGYTQLTINLGGIAFDVESATDGDDLLLLVTPHGSELRAPALMVEASLLWNRPGYAVLDGECLVGYLPEHQIRVHATRAPVSDPNLPVRSPYLALPLDAGSVAVCTGRPRSLDEISDLVCQAREREASSHEQYGDLADVHRAMQACLAWNVIYEPLCERVICPVSRLWSRQRLGYVVFCWDSFFAASMLALDDRELGYACALETLGEMVDGQYVPSNAQGSGRRSWDRSQPPVGAITILQIYQRYEELWFLRMAWEPLLAWNRWWDRARRNADGLLSWGSSPFEPQVGDPLEFRQPNTLLGAVLESGLNNSPMYDDVPFDPEAHLMCLSDVGLNALYVADCAALAEIASELGHDDAADELRARAAAYGERMDCLWDDEAGIYLNRRVDTGALSDRLSPTNFYPLLAGVASEIQSARMAVEHFYNADEFWGEWIMPSIARCDPAYPDQDYWRGRIWAPMNYLVYLGLRKYPRLAGTRRDLVERSVALLMAEWRAHGRVYENYCAETGLGGNVPNSDPYYHWGGLLGFIALIEAGF
jgi:putative isomerase